MKYCIYKDREWLLDRYETQRCSMKEMAEEAGCGVGSIHRWMHRHNIKARDIGLVLHERYSKSANLSNGALDFIYGELLGDGCVSMAKRSGVYSHSNKHKEYLEWLSSSLNGFGISGNGIRRHVSDGKSLMPPGVVYWSYCSSTYKDFADLRALWYPNGDKIVPRCVALTPITVRQWYIGDGCLAHVKPPRKGNPSVSLATMCFVKEDLEFLSSELLSLGFRNNIWSSGVIGISAKCTRAFLDYIGPCPQRIQNIYGYKWDLERTKKQWEDDLKDD